MDKVNRFEKFNILKRIFLFALFAALFFFNFATLAPKVNAAINEITIPNQGHNGAFIIEDFYVFSDVCLPGEETTTVDSKQVACSKWVNLDVENPNSYINSDSNYKYMPTGETRHVFKLFTWNSDPVALNVFEWFDSSKGNKLDLDGNTINTSEKNYFLDTKDGLKSFLYNLQVYVPNWILKDDTPVYYSSQRQFNELHKEQYLKSSNDKFYKYAE